VREEGLTQAKIGERVGWTKQYVSYFSSINDNLSTKVLALAKKNQSGRVDKKSTSVDFTEGWFRDSGLYDLGGQHTATQTRLFYPIGG
jgi:transcriptional regulator with XRE-family HTH domain